jgi:hypothetical protein
MAEYEPLGFDAGDQNWYRAIGNNPGNGNDPSGLDFGIGGLVVDEMPEIPRNPLGIEVPKNPEDTFWGLIKDDIRDTGSQIVGMLPGVGDYKDIQEFMFGYDMITGKWLTVNARLWTAGAALVPGLGGATIRKLAKILDPVGNLVGKNIDDLPGPSSAWRQDIAPTSVRPSVNSSLPSRVTQELPAGGMRTPAENEQARNFFERNREAARKWWSDRNGGKPLPKDSVHDSHPRPLKDGGDPLFIESSYDSSIAPHMIPQPPDGLTDFQRWGAMGGRPRDQ